MIHDKQIAGLNKKEEAKQKNYINLIASENYSSKDVREAMSSVAINKYSEGYPGKRYYPGNEFLDTVEIVAQERALKLFGLNQNDWHVNVQPYSGSPANVASYYGLIKFLQAEDEALGNNKTPTREILAKTKILAMRLDQGGHLTHGHTVSFTGDVFNFSHYGVDANGLLDYKNIAEVVKKEKPTLIVCGATAYPRQIDFEKFGRIAEEAGAYLMADISHIAGLVAAKEHKSPFPYCDIVTTTTHKTLRGPRGAMIFVRKGVNFLNTQKKRHEDLYEFIDKAVFPGLQGGPHNHKTLALAVALNEATLATFKKYQQQVKKNAATLAAELQKYGFNILTGGTDNHLLLIDLRNKNISGTDAERWLYEAGIIVNRNSIPNDPAPPLRPSGIRLGTPAITTRNAKEKDMKQIALFISDTIKNPKSATATKKKVFALTRKLKNI
jgi:glycine hydroxymethyltransferase